MLGNHLRVAWRSLWNHKGYTFVNVLGLAIGMACCGLILRYVQYEFGFDRFHSNADRIYRLTRERFWNQAGLGLHSPTLFRSCVTNEVSGGAGHLRPRVEMRLRVIVRFIECLVVAVWASAIVAGASHAEEGDFGRVNDVLVARGRRSHGRRYLLRSTRFIETGLSRFLLVLSPSAAAQVLHPTSNGRPTLFRV